MICTNGLILRKIQILGNGYRIEVQTTSHIDDTELDAQTLGRALDASGLGPWKHAVARSAGEVTKNNGHEFSLHTTVDGVGRAKGLDGNVVEADTWDVREGRQRLLSTTGTTPDQLELQHE
jgi:hypothetical protein